MALYIWTEFTKIHGYGFDNDQCTLVNFSVYLFSKTIFKFISNPQRYEERMQSPPPVVNKPGMAFQITFDDPKRESPRGKKKRETPPKPVR